MEEGTATVHGTAFGFLFFGWSHQHLFFRGSSGASEVIVPSGDSVDAKRCPGCDLVVLDNQSHTQKRMNARARKLGKFLARKGKRSRSD